MLLPYETMNTVDSLVNADNALDYMRCDGVLAKWNWCIKALRAVSLFGRDDEVEYLVKGLTPLVRNF